MKLENFVYLVEVNKNYRSSEKTVKLQKIFDSVVGEEFDQNTKIFYKEDNTDSIATVSILLDYFQNKFKIELQKEVFVPIDANIEKYDFKQNAKFVIFAGYTPSSSVLEKMVNDGVKAVVVDHRKTEADRLIDYSKSMTKQIHAPVVFFVNVDNSASSAEMTHAFAKNNLHLYTVSLIGFYERTQIDARWREAQALASFINNRLSTVYGCNKISTVFKFLFHIPNVLMSAVLKYYSHYETLKTAAAANVITSSKQLYDSKGVVRGLVFTTDKNLAVDVSNAVLENQKNLYITCAITLYKNRLEYLIMSKDNEVINALDVASVINGAVGQLDKACFSSSINQLDTIISAIEAKVNKK